MATAEEFTTMVHALDQLPTGDSCCDADVLVLMRKPARPRLHPMNYAIMEGNVMPAIDEGYYRFIGKLHD